MRTVLVLAKQPGLAEAIRAVLDPGAYRVIHQAELWAAEPLFSREIFDACVLDADLTDVRPLRVLEQMRRAMPRCPIFVYASARQWEWEEEAYLLGVEHVLAKPIRGRLLLALLDRCGQESRPPMAAVVRDRPEGEVVRGAPLSGSARTLEVLRDFSAILTHSLQTDSLLKQFLLLLREVISVNRAAIFLRQAPGGAGTAPGSPAGRRLHSACALGLPAALLEHLELSLDSGIGGYVHRQGRILRSGSEEARNSREIQKEFELLGGQVAIPILDRETLVGVAVFDGRLTGELFSNEELSLIFHLLEGLGLAIKNSWLHDELSSNHQLIADVLNQLESGCVVVAQNLSVLHANRTAKAYFNPRQPGGVGLEFSDLPPALASRVYELLQTGNVLPPFKYESPAAPGRVFRVAITPFLQTHSLPPKAVMLLLEDCTQHERAQRLEIETASLRLMRSMAEHLAHEIGNSLVPISTFHQLLIERGVEAEMQSALGGELSEGIRRIARLSSQMQFLARDSYARREEISVKDWIEESFQAARLGQLEKAARLELETDAAAAVVVGDPAALRHALFEVFLNALQAAPREAPIMVRVMQVADRGGRHGLRVEVEDAGPGFTPEGAQRAAEPFYSTRTVGLGLGLTVARRIVEAHQGILEIVAIQAAESGVVRLWLPAAEGLPRRDEAGL